MQNKYDLLVVGGGILGLFHAYHALQKKLKVAIIEKNSLPSGASVRNFGQVIHLQ
ncbi:FAD-dependent oxidoreductase [Flavobacterium sp. LM5]|uniref:FAD-dependent oxidoreductase n=1 Tax=Flavobacterium sp. LM5 TaxID=1938610 RepID=UPI0026D292FE